MAQITLDQQVQETNDQMAGAKFSSDYLEMVFQKLMRDYYKLEERVDSHDCKGVSCSTCLEYQEFCNQYIYES